MRCTNVFTVNTGFRSGRTPDFCPPCRIERTKEQNRVKSTTWRQRHPEQSKEIERRNNTKRLADPAFLKKKRQNEARRKYGLSVDQVDALIEAQGGKCAICGKACEYTGKRGNGGTFHIDHNHSTAQIRGLLCGNCNTMIGLAKDDPVILMAAVQYLQN